MARRPSLKLRLEYWFDKTMARGTPALICWLLMICLVVVIPASIVLVWADVDTPPTLKNQLVAIWMNISQTFNLRGGVGAPLVVLMSVVLGLVGLFFASTLIGLLTSAVRDKLMDLRRGRSMVLEQGHTVLLGWSDEVLPIISELVEANANRRRAAVAVLANKDKTEMEDEIHAKVPDTGGTKVICRTGSPVDQTDIDRVSPHVARSVIVMPPGNEDSDARIVKALLALTKRSESERKSYHIVAAVQNRRNVEATQLAGGAQAYVLSVDDITARLIVQTSRQSGLSAVITELLSFAGDEFYMRREPKLVDKTFGDALLAYDTSSVVGLLHADGTIALTPVEHPDLRGRPDHRHLPGR
ncbi:CASTOR/POLLUX-related putative ion channel [Streptomyces sirii]|uniref:CASTOR/POLLUX-related putative ion channel n=1 Tax=Streptomyces sirii TaxID=3127701 RepID=UPI003D367F8F